MKRRVILAALVVLGAAAAGKAFSASQTVLIAAFNYLPGQSDVAGVAGTDVFPETLTVAAGDDLSVTNVDPIAHTITSDDLDPINHQPLFDTGNIGLLGSVRDHGGASARNLLVSLHRPHVHARQAGRAVGRGAAAATTTQAEREKFPFFCPFPLAHAWMLGVRFPGSPKTQEVNHATASLD